jgi:protoporphyrinogen oxidase
MKVAIVGGGVMGVTLGYYLSKEGVEVEIFEASPTLGGLAGQIRLPDGTLVDRFYHAILSSDTHVRNLCDELGIADWFRFHETRTGFYRRGKIYSMDHALDFLRFAPLSPIERARLAWTVIQAQRVGDWSGLEAVGVREWLTRLGGGGVYEKLWRPMLAAKFDGSFEETPATYMWSRLVRMKSARKGPAQKELVGHLIGGHVKLIEAVVEHIQKAGGVIHLKTPVREIMINGSRAWGLRVDDAALAYDAVIATLPVPHIRRLIADATPAYSEFLAKTEYLGVVAVLLVLDRPLSGYWTLNIIEDGSPLTGVIETTTYIDPHFVGDHHLVYMPKYTAPGSRWQKTPDEEVRRIWLQTLEGMFPEFDRGWIRYCLIHRERYVESLHPMNGLSLIPPVTTPIEGLYLATAAQIYPALTNAESVTVHARAVANTVLETREKFGPVRIPKSVEEMISEHAPA